jgi:mannose-6-phosphate isomerase-like protein (cupin superfamily)
MVKIAVSAVVAMALCVPAMMLGQDNGSAAPATAPTQPAQALQGAAQRVPGRQPHPQGPAPIQNKILVFQGAQVQAQLAQLVEQAKITHHGGAELARSGNIAMQLSVMPGNGPGELHRNADDLLMIQQGNATVVTGGTMVNGRDFPGGNTFGSGLEGGVSTPVGPGDIVLIPAGLTHQLLVPPGTILVMIVGKIVEP